MAALNPLNWLKLIRKDSSSEAVKYVNEDLFKHGKNSDVTLVILGKKWNLHRQFLSQSRYFESMFQEGWAEANQREITITLPDPNITIKGVETLLATMYDRDVPIVHEELLGITSAAVHFDSRDLLGRCIATMKDIICSKNALLFYEMSKHYHIDDITTYSANWLNWNFMVEIVLEPERLKEVLPTTLCEIVSSPNLYLQYEFGLYEALAMWLFLQLNPNWKGKVTECSNQTHKFFADFPGNIWETEAASKLAEPFQHLRVHHLILRSSDLNTLFADKLIPKQEIEGHMQIAWKRIMEIASGYMRSLSKLTTDEFNKFSYRCGRVVPSKGRYRWRWSGMHFGLDLLMLYNQRVLKFKRNISKRGKSKGCVYQGSSQPFHYRVTVSYMNKCNVSTHTITSGIVSNALLRSQDYTIMKLPPEVRFPFYLVANFLMVSPLPN